MTAPEPLDLRAAASTDQQTLPLLKSQLRRDLATAEEVLRRQEALLDDALADPLQTTACRRLQHRARDLARRRVQLVRVTLALALDEVEQGPTDPAEQETTTP